jgi:hypothetical protein
VVTTRSNDTMCGGESLAACHASFCQLADRSADLVVLACRDHGVVFINSAGRRMLGLTDAACAGAALDLGDPAVASGAPITLRHAMTGEPVPLECEVFPIAATGGAPPGMALIGRAPASAARRQLASPASETRADVAVEIAMLERIAAPSPATAITARMLGVAPLAQRAPRAYRHILEAYLPLLDLALQRHTYRRAADDPADRLRAIAERLGELDAGAREVADLHATALRLKVRSATPVKAQAYTEEGRLVAFELMGHLLSFYRRRTAMETRRG